MGTNVTFTVPMGGEPAGRGTQKAASFAMRLLVFAMWFFAVAVTVAIPPIAIVTVPLGIWLLVRKARRRGNRTV